jgi:hypothetical protein
MRAYGVLIGANQGEALLDEICEAVFRLDDMRGDLPALEVIFLTFDLHRLISDLWRQMIK